MFSKIDKSIAVLAIAASVSGLAHAGLVKEDLHSSGDQLITLDTATNLEWLNVNATQGQSVDQILGGLGGWTQSGFQYATFGQVGQLLNDAGYMGSISSYESLQLVANGTDAATFVTDLGATSPPNFIFGLMAPYPCVLPGGPASCTDYVQINAHGNGGNGYAIADSGPFIAEHTPSYAGSFLVRVVPEPASIELLVAGLGLLGAMAGKARRKQPRQ